jgi:thiol-disulfide isomerase/thioredoxin
MNIPATIGKIEIKCRNVRAIMKLCILTIVIFFSFRVSAQDLGIHFEQGLSWSQIKSKAQKQHKFIFVDCYASWCAPCKYMAQNIFPQKQSGDALNLNFISVEFQLDSTSKDSDLIKNRYSDAKMILIKYKIQAYPTFLFFNPMGELVHRSIGAMTVSDFVKCTKDAMDSSRQFISLMNKYRLGNRDTILLENLAKETRANGNEQLADSVFKDWFLRVKWYFTDERLKMIAQITKSPSDPGFKIFLKNEERVNKIVGKDFAESIVSNIIIQNDSDIIKLFSDSTKIPNWTKIGLDIDDKFGKKYSRYIVTWIKIPYYKRKENWNLYGKVLANYVREYGDELSFPDLNNYAWEIFEYCVDSVNLKIGLAAAGHALLLSGTTPPTILDTYANLLYKLGNTTEGIAKEENALKLADSSQKKSFQETLGKMKTGQKTWQ